MPRPGRDGREPGRLGAVTLSSKALGRLAGLAPARTDQVSVERNLPAKMDDGAVLLADRWFPSGPLAEVPTVLIRTPYGRRQMGMVGRLFAERGYQMVIQSVRGTFGSEGRFDPFRNERADGRATLDWVAGQPWFDGRLATFGPSYLGLTQWAVSEEAPAYLRAMALEVTASDFPGTVTYPGGSFALETGLAWIHQVSHQELSPCGCSGPRWPPGGRCTRGPGSCPCGTPTWPPSDSTWTSSVTGWSTRSPATPGGSR